jgi:hypothetical protein
MSHDTGYTSSADRIQIQVSTNQGQDWTDVGSPILRYDPAYTTPGWGLHTVSLATYAGEQSVMVGFLGISAYGNNFFLDDVAIQDVCGHPMVIIGPDRAGSACPGTSIDYTLNVKNVNLVPDTIDITLPGYVWPTSVAPTSLDLGPNETGQVVVTVQVPWSASVGDSDVATVTATAQGSSATDSAAVTTTAKGDGLASAMQNMATGAEGDLYWGHSYYEDGHVCVVGGLSGTGTIVVSGEHHCYDIATATWFDRASMPNPLMGGAYGLIGGKFYIAGGFDVSFVGYDYLQIYDIATDTWGTGAALPSARGGAAGGAVGGKLYSAGGSGTSSFPLDCPTYEYDPAGDYWTGKAACPLQATYGFDLGGSVGSDYWGLLFAGGHFNATYGWYAYDPAGDTWATLANLPFHKTPLIVENPNTGDIYSISGLLGWVAQNQIWKYDYTANTWADTGVRLLTTQGGSLGPAHGSFGDPTIEGFWTEGGTIGSGALAPAPFELWEYETCPTCEPPSNVDFTFSPDYPVPAQPVHFEATAQSTEPITYTWDFGDGTVGSGPEFYHAYTYVGTYVVRLTASNACGQQVVQHEVLVQAPQYQYMHLLKQKMNSRTAMPPYYKVVVKGIIHDQNHAVLAGVTVTGHWTYPDSTTETVTAVTDLLGRYKFLVRKTMCELYQFDIDSLAKAGYTDDPAHDHSSRHIEKLVPCN